MKKNVIVLLLCISSNNVGMHQSSLSNTSDENILKSIRRNRTSNQIIQTRDGNTPLHTARGRDKVQSLVSLGALVEQKNNKGETPLFTLFRNMTTFCLDTAHALCAAGADVNARDKQNNTPLHCAAKNLSLAEIKFLLHRGASFDVVNDQEETAYQIAKKRGGDVLKAFEECKNVFNAINVSIPDNHSLTIFSLLADGGEELKQILMLDSYGYCSSDIGVVEELFRQCDRDVWNELRSDISPYSADALSLLQCVGDRCDYRKSFMKSLDENDFAKASDLVQKNPYLLYMYDGEYERDDVNTLFVEKFISTPFSDAQYCYLREMIYSGFFDVDSCDASGDPLLIAVIQEPNSGDKYLDLLHAGADVNAKNQGGYTPLLLAVMLEKEDVVLQLLSYGAVVNKDFGGQFVLPDSMRQLIDEAYNKQRCFMCRTHEYDLESIPERRKRCYV